MKKRIAMILVFALIVSVLVPGSVEAKKDKKKPTLALIQTITTWTRTSVPVNVTAKDKSGIKSLLWKKGKITKKKAALWYGAKDIKKKKTFKAPANGWYSVKATDKAGNSKIANLQITNIDKTGPAVTLKYKVSNKVATVTVTASDPRGVLSMRWGTGYLTTKSVSNFPNVVQNNTFQFKQNGYCTVRTTDNLGNVSLTYLKVKLWHNLTALKIFDSDAAGALEGSVEDRWGSIYTNPWGIRPSVSGDSYAEYFLNGKYKKFSGSVVRGKRLGDSDTVWLQVLVDDNVVYTSKKMGYKTPAVKFDVNIKSGKYMKIKAFAVKADYDSYFGWERSSEGLYITNGQLYN